MPGSGPRDGEVAVAGATLRYVVEGTGVPVLVVGSATYYPRTFSRQLRDFCTLAFADMRHFAPCDASFDVGSLTFDTYADEIDGIRAAVGFERCVVVGHSKHGNLALEYAMHYPERATHVVIIGSPPCGGKRIQTARNEYWDARASPSRKAVLRRNWDELTPVRLASLSPAESVVARYVADGPKYWFDPAYDATPLWQGVHVNSAVVDKLHDLFEDYEWPLHPNRLRMPILVVMGRYDFAVPQDLWDERRSQIPNAKHHLFESSGHTPQFEEQELFDAVFILHAARSETSSNS